MRNRCLGPEGAITAVDKQDMVACKKMTILNIRARVSWLGENKSLLPNRRLLKTILRNKSDVANVDMKRVLYLDTEVRAKKLNRLWPPFNIKPTPESRAPKPELTLDIYTFNKRIDKIMFRIDIL